MTKYEKQILNVLLDKYEKSKSFIGINQVNQSFTCKVDQLFPKYKDDSEYDLFCAVNESIDILVAEGFVTAKKLKNGVLQSVTLIVEAIEKVYEYLGRTPKSDTVSELKRLLNHYKDDNDILHSYCNHQLDSAVFQFVHNIRAPLGNLVHHIASVAGFADDFGRAASSNELIACFREVLSELRQTRLVFFLDGNKDAPGLRNRRIGT